MESWVSWKQRFHGGEGARRRRGLAAMAERRCFALGGSDASGQQRQAGHGAWWPRGGRCLSPVGTVLSSNFLHSVADQLTDSAYSSPPNSKTVAS